MRKSINPLTPTPGDRYAVQARQPHRKLGGAHKALGEMILTVLFAAAARVGSLADTCRRLRGVPDAHVVAAARYATPPEYNARRRRVPAARRGHRPKALRRRPRVVARDWTSLPSDGADAKTDPLVVRSEAKEGTGSSCGSGTASVVREGRR